MGATELEVTKSSLTTPDGAPTMAASTFTWNASAPGPPSEPRHLAATGLKRNIRGPSRTPRRHSPPTLTFNHLGISTCVPHASDY